MRFCEFANPFALPSSFRPVELCVPVVPASLPVPEATTAARGTRLARRSLPSSRRNNARPSGGGIIKKNKWSKNIQSVTRTKSSIDVLMSTSKQLLPVRLFQSWTFKVSPHVTEVNVSASREIDNFGKINRQTVYVNIFKSIPNYYEIV